MDYKPSGVCSRLIHVELDGDILLQEANSELDKIREELEAKRNKLIILN